MYFVGTMKMQHNILDFVSSTQVFGTESTRPAYKPNALGKVGKTIRNSSLAALLGACFLMTACDPYVANATITPTVTNKSAITTTYTPTAIATVELSPTAIHYQILGRIFPEENDSPGVWANQNTGAIDSRTTHFDVTLPIGYIPGNDVVISPASGRIVEVYSVGEGEGQVITIEPFPPLEGIDDLALLKGLNLSDIQTVYFHIGHITPYKTEGFVEKGEIIGSPVDFPGRDKVAYVIRVIMKHGERQYSPCDLPNTAEFCGKCAPGTKNPCP
jgi:hypothetical protein